MFGKAIIVTFAVALAGARPQADDTLDNGCPSDWDVHRVLPHETECGKFYYCVRGERILRECQSGTHFNVKQEVCDWVENAGCTLNDGGNTDVGEKDKEETNNGNPLCPLDWDIHHLVAHETKCNQFYYCVQGQLVLRSCPSGTHFNAELQVCDWPENAGCSGDVDDNNSENDGDSSQENDNGNNNGNPLCPSDWDIHHLVKNEEDCTKFYYCVRGGLVPRDCPTGLHFNEKIQVCDWPENAGCANSGGDNGSGNTGNSNSNEESSSSGDNSSDDNSSDDNSSDDNSSNGGDNNSNGGDNNSSDNNGSGGDTQSGESENPGSPLCPTDWDVHHLVPKEDDCTGFYYCVNGNLVPRDCPHGLHFNADSQVCDWPEQARCTANGGASSGEGNTHESIDSSSEESIPGSPLCPTDWDVHHLVPKEDDCTGFYYCVHGNLVPRDCPTGLHFNSAIQVCDWPENAGCANSGGDNGSGNTGNSNSNEESSSSGDNSSDDNSSDDNSSNGGDNNSNGGDNNSSDNNGSGGDTQSGESENPGSPLCPTDWDVHHLVPKEDDCTGFYYCVNGNLVPRDCPHGLHFNADSQVCDWPEQAHCTANGGASSGEGNTHESIDSSSEESIPGSPLCPTDWDVHHLVPKEDDCTGFYYCVHGNLVPRDCPTGLHFNSAIQVCDWPANAGCTAGGGNSGEGDSSGDNSSEDNNSGNSSSGSSEEGNVGPGNECESQCITKHWAHAADCDKFWRCDGNEKVLGVCSEGLHFNPDIQTCDFMCNVRCVRSHTQITQGENGLTVFLPWVKANKSLIDILKRTA